MNHLLAIFLSCCFLWSSIETTLAEGNSLLPKSVEVAAVKPQPEKSIRKTKMTREQRLFEAAQAANKQLLREKVQQAMSCGEEKYFDPVSDSCQECSQLCEDSSAKYCQLHCPWKYAEYQLMPEIDKLWITIYAILSVLGVLVVLVFGYLAYCLVSKKRRDTKSSRDNESHLGSVCDSNEHKKKATYFNDEDEIIKKNKTALPETEQESTETKGTEQERTERIGAHQEQNERTETEPVVTGRTETENGRLVAPATSPVSDNEETKLLDH